MGGSISLKKMFPKAVQNPNTQDVVETQQVNLIENCTQHSTSTLLMISLYVLECINLQLCPSQFSGCNEYASVLQLYAHVHLESSPHLPYVARAQVHELISWSRSVVSWSRGWFDRTPEHPPYGPVQVACMPVAITCCMESTHI